MNGNTNQGVTVILARALLCIFVLAIPLHAHSIVIRHDVADAQYRASQADFPPLATLYNIGVHGTLIHPQWIVTAAHAVFCMNPGQSVRVGNEFSTVIERYSHSNYKLGGAHDISLLRLSKPIQGVLPAKLFEGKSERGMVTWFIGAGGTGTGLEGQTMGYKENKGVLRKAQNKITNVTASDIVFKFEKGSDGEPLEGVSGNGDSGGPAYIQKNGQYELVGISSRADSWFLDVGEYGVTELYTRVSAYKDWIAQVMQASDESERLKISTQAPFLHEGMKSKNMKELCSSLEVR